MLWWIIGTINQMGDNLLRNQKQAIEQATADRKVQFDYQRQFITATFIAQASNMKHSFEKLTDDLKSDAEQMSQDIIKTIKGETDKIGATADRIETNTEMQLNSQANTVQESVHQAKVAAQSAAISAHATSQTVKKAIPEIKGKPLLQRLSNSIFGAPTPTPTRHRRRR